MHANLPRPLPLFWQLRLQRLLDTTANAWGLHQPVRRLQHLNFAISY
jgi:hypothetical protein